MKKYLKVCQILVVSAVYSVAHSGVLLVNNSDTIAIGVNENGSLISSGASPLPVRINNKTSQVYKGTSLPAGPSPSVTTGLAYKFQDGFWYDALTPGCFCEGWGVSINNSISGFANQAETGPSGVNLTFGGLTEITPNSAKSTVSLASYPGLVVTHQFQPATTAGALFRVRVVISNNTSSPISDVKYVRAMDWDIPPTEFSEIVTVKGVGNTSKLERSHDDGFASVDPLGTESSGIMSDTLNVDFSHFGPEDHGAYFRFNFGTIEANSNQTFDIFFGVAPTELDALSAISSEGIELYSLGQSSGSIAGEPATFIFGFKGVGGVPVGSSIAAVPTLSEWSMLLLVCVVGFVASLRGRRLLVG